jgi:hypothetical protein
VAVAGVDKWWTFLLFHTVCMSAGAWLLARARSRAARAAQAPAAV